MVKYISAAGAARVLGINEKTVRNWIEDGKLKARKVAKNRFNVLAADVEALRREREKNKDETPGISRLVARIEELERKYADLEQKYVELSSAVAEKVEKQAVRQPVMAETVRAPAVQKRTTVASASVPVDLPQGSMLFADFAARYGVP